MARTKDSTSVQKAVDRLLRDRGTTLEAWLAERRAEGLTYEEIAEALEIATGIKLSRETIRQWMVPPGAGYR